ncbi:hypothetical protein BDN72DRAFT_413821 [Pluteus cervinus]|uniref:Uncharacterized protein n=1 Tax=Pluteus cervinus TaxID=181527 RepID=A0ACD3A7W9_9AGAR|nr:hypothetical protein BDN72DRAFT_413821 [Pluteus cervinus]
MSRIVSSSKMCSHSSAGRVVARSTFLWRGTRELLVMGDSRYGCGQVRESALGGRLHYLHTASTRTIPTLTQHNIDRWILQSPSRKICLRGFNLLSQRTMTLHRIFYSYVRLGDLRF